MNFATSEIPQWTELGAELSGPNADAKRAEILDILRDLEISAENSLRTASGEVANRLQSLLKATATAKQIAGKVLKPIDLSAL